MNHAKRGDMVITQDIGLASTLLPKKVVTISPKGFLFEEKDIYSALMFGNKRMTKEKGMYGKGPKPSQFEDWFRFLTKLRRILSKIAGI